MDLGSTGYLKREDVLAEYLEDGSLVIEVDIRIAAENKLAWYPKTLHQQEILVELYHDASETSDRIFNVEGKMYHAHKSVFSRRAKTFFELGKEYKAEQTMIHTEIFFSSQELIHLDG